MSMSVMVPFHHVQSLSRHIHTGFYLIQDVCVPKQTAFPTVEQSSIFQLVPGLTSPLIPESTRLASSSLRRSMRFS